MPPTYVENEFRRYLECGLHAHGFARAISETRGDELLLPFSIRIPHQSPRTSGGDRVTHFGRALNELSIDIICANSTPAKGRVERANSPCMETITRTRGVSIAGSAIAGGPKRNAA